MGLGEGGGTYGLEGSTENTKAHRHMFLIFPLMISLYKGIRFSPFEVLFGGVGGRGTELFH